MKLIRLTAILALLTFAIILSGCLSQVDNDITKDELNSAKDKNSNVLRNPEVLRVKDQKDLISESGVLEQDLELLESDEIENSLDDDFDFDYLEEIENIN